MAQAPNAHLYNAAAATYQQLQPAPQARPTNLPNVKIVKLPFYDVQAELLKPAGLIPHGGSRFQVC